MKIVVNSIVVSLLLLSSSCKDASENRVISETDTSSPLQVNQQEQQCFLYAHQNDTIKLSLNQTGTSATGQLIYNFYEKDGSFGSYEGQIKGDTLLANYTFEAEGTTSQREIIMLKTDKGWLPGYGDVEMQEDQRMVFKKNSSISFDELTPLNRINCDKIKF